MKFSTIQQPRMKAIWLVDISFGCSGDNLLASTLESSFENMLITLMSQKFKTISSPLFLVS
jgi:hypothetical protein